jgi:monomeric phenylalanine-4-hydroxylase
MQKVFPYQDYSLYSEQDHSTWFTLTDRHHQLHMDHAAREYCEGIEKLNIDRTRIIKIETVSDTLKLISGWSLVPVSGLLSTKDFFYLLIEKKYPVTVYIRKASEIEFSEQPDIFHDVFGHLPLLTNEKFTKFLTAYSTIALKYINNDKAIELLGRLYWFTYEMGLILEDGAFKPYGGAVITSSQEIVNVANQQIPKHLFNIDHVFSTLYNSFKIQNEYFFINSFEDLFDCLDTIESKLIRNLLMPEVDNVLRNYPLNQKLGKQFNDVIGLLNGIQFRFPDAISFVAGQPDKNFFEIENHLGKFTLFVDHIMRTRCVSRIEATNYIAQYNKTKGIINDVISKYLKIDENIDISEEHILITVGAQEAFSIIVSAICNRENDVILMEDPSYIGVSSFANIFNYNVEGVPVNEDGIDLVKLKSKIIEVNNSGRHVKILYVIPDYQNPSGFCMPVGNRLKLMELAKKYNFLIIEDSVYNSFTYCEKRQPTMKSLDSNKRVIYVGSFSKSLFPGLRVGLIVADQQIENEEGVVVDLIDQMTKVKAQLTNNTSTISQAITAGVLIDLQFSLSNWSKPKYRSYKAKCDYLMQCLNDFIGVHQDGWARDISWSVPGGGFFIKLRVPFIINNYSIAESAEKFNVIFCPMSHFYLKGGGENEIRLTFSNLSIEEIKEGTKRLSHFLEYKILETITSNTLQEIL